jgi:hypothetical protein
MRVMVGGVELASVIIVEVPAVSAVTPIADKFCGAANVRYVPLATNAPQQTVSLFDHLVSAGGQMQPIERYQ